jgi:hypothetical protein
MIPSQSPTNVEASACQAVVVAQSDGLYGVQFELVNASDAPVTLDSYTPFLQFRLHAEAGGAPVAVEEPTLDLPLQPVKLTVAARGTLPLRTPIRLRFGAGAAPTEDGFVWSITRPLAELTLVFTLDLPAPFGQPCHAQVEAAK